jgi:hypothetical protein
MRRALLSTVPPGAAVAVDGRTIGMTPMTVSWPIGSSTEVAITREGFLPTSATLGERQHAKMLTLELVQVPGGEHLSGP